MKQLNYNHLYYFYLTAKEGSIAAACKLLHVTPQTVSGQLATLEDYLGLRLFERHGKRLILNDNGKLMYSYAEDIFNLGHELLQRLEPSQRNRQMTFTIGITDVIPKVFAYELMKPIFDQEQMIKLICKEGEQEQLLADLALNKLDAILSDRPIPPGHSVKAHNHKIAESGLSFYVSSHKKSEISANFPQSLNGQPLLLPGEQSSIKLSILSWLDDNDLHPNIVAEFDDSALTKLFGQSGYGVFCTPSMVEQHVLDTYQVEVIGRTDEVIEHFYLISSERKTKHPAIICLKENFNF